MAERKTLASEIATGKKCHNSEAITTAIAMSVG